MIKFTTRLLTAADLSVLSNVAPDVFDDPINEAASKKFLEDPNSVLVVAILQGAPLRPAPQDEGKVIGFASGLVYGHPDKDRPEMFINEVGVAPPYHRQGIGKEIMKILLAEAKKRDCRCAWVPTDDDNEAAKALYNSAGGNPPEQQIHIDFDLSD